MSSSSSSGNAGITLKAEITFRSYGPITDSPGTPYYCADWDNQAGMLAYSPAGGGHGEQWVGTAGPATLTYFLGVAGDAFLRFETGACGQGTYSILLSSTPTDAYCGLFIVNLTGNCCSTPAYDFTLEIRIFNPNGACPTPPVCAKCLAASQAPVRYATGELSLSAADFQSNGFGIPWGHTRSFSSRLTTPVNLGNGWNWQIREWTYLILDNLRRGTTSITTAVLMGEAGQTVWFDKTAGVFVPRYGELDSLVLDLNSQAFYHTTTDGITTVYSALSGALLSKQDQAGNTLTVISRAANTFNITEVQRSYTTGGITTTESFQYTYDDPTSAKALLTTVLLRRKVGSGDWTGVQRANYTYYGYADPNGNPGDLQTVATQTWTGSAWADTGTTYYRYYARPVTVSGSSSSSLSSLSSASSLSSSSAGALILHALKFVLLPTMYDQMVANSFNPLSASNAQLSLYADFYYEYDTNGRVVRETVKAGSQTFAFSSVQSAFSDGYNNWSTKTTETLPDGNQNIVYTNYAGLTMLKVFQATATSSSSSSGSSSSGSTANQWCTYFRYNSTGKLILQANPSVVSGFDEKKADLVNWQGNTAQYLKNNAGLINTYTYDSASGFKSGDLVQQGTLGLPIIVRQYEYVACCVTANSSSSSSNPSSSPTPALPCRYLPSKLIEYPDDGTLGSSSSSSGAASGTANGNTRQIITTYSYTFWPDTCAVQQKTTTWPVIPTSQNGSGVAAQMFEYFDVYGNLIWIMDERGYITGMTYDVPTGALIQRIDDVDTTLVSAPAGWTTPADGGLHLITDFEHDDRGRQTQSLGPVHEIDLDGVATEIRSATYTVYLDAFFQSWIGQGFQKAEDGSFFLINPVTITITRKDGKVTDQIEAVRFVAGSSSSSSAPSSSGSTATAPVTTAGKLTSLEKFPQSSYCRWTTNQFTDCCLAASQRVYKLIPATGIGGIGTNYDETDFGYDVMKRQNRLVTPGGTITRTVFDARGLPVSAWTGTNDTGATAANPAGTGSPNNMVTITAVVYDGSSSYPADGNITQQTDYVDATGTHNRITTLSYDFRNRLLDTVGPTAIRTTVSLDNLGRALNTAQYSTTQPAILQRLTARSFDDRGSPYTTTIFSVAYISGAVGASITTNTWRDSSRNVIKFQAANSSLFVKTSLDSIGRPHQQYIGCGSDSSYADVLSIAHNLIITELTTTFDAASTVIAATVKERYHSAPDGDLGPLGDPTTSPLARASYGAFYCDALGRRAAVADFGTNGGTQLIRPSVRPQTSDTCLVTTTRLNARAEHALTVDPSGTACFTSYDDLGRRLTVIEAYDACSSSSSSASSGCGRSSDTNRTTRFTYTDDGLLSTVTAINTMANQTTEYQYGTSLADSAVATTFLRRAIVYPDSVAGDDTKVYSYNRQAEVRTAVQQNGTVHEYVRDTAGRIVHDCVTSLGTNTDGTARRISYEYDLRDLPTILTTFDNATVVAGAVLSQVQKDYNGFGQLITEYQSHAGSINPATTPRVQYTYAEGVGNSVRRTSLTYPNGRQLAYSYTGSVIDDAASRVSALIDDNGAGPRIAEYKRLGADAVVEVLYPEPNIEYTLVGTDTSNDPATGDIYKGLDRFSRPKHLLWTSHLLGSSSSSNSSGSRLVTTLIQIQRRFDHVDNPCWRRDIVAEHFDAPLDESYRYDRLNRLVEQWRGVLSSDGTTMTAVHGRACWSLDYSGNWSESRVDDTGSGNWAIVQRRTANRVNEIDSIDSIVGPVWSTPLYDANGNMSTLPAPADPTSSADAIYDAWDRLVELRDVSSDRILQSQWYDARNFRTERHVFNEGVLVEQRHFYYTSAWQAIEERLGASTSPAAQYIWGMRTDDDLVMRERDVDGTGELSERLYALNDINDSVVAIANREGLVEERYVYSPYGAATACTPDFSPRGASAFGWEVLFAGYHLDLRTALYQVRRRVLNSALGTFMTRDPMGLSDITTDGRGLNMYEYVLGRPLVLTDPTGLVPMGVSLNPVGFKGGKTCVITMSSWADQKHHPLPKPDEDRWNLVGNQLVTALGGSEQAVLIQQVNSQKDVLDAIKNNQCCQVVLMGHRGGPDFPGGIQTGNAQRTKPVPILPDESFEKQIAAAIRGNNCKKCRIFVYACGTRGTEGRENQERLARLTGCIVCGTRVSICLGCPGSMEGDPGEFEGKPADFDPKTPAKEPPVECVDGKPQPYPIFVPIFRFF